MRTSKIYQLLLVIGLMGPVTTSTTAECFRLGWAGGAAGKKVKWVNAWEGKDPNGRPVLRYAWKNGYLRSNRETKNMVYGTWHQDGSPGGSFALRIQREATPWCFTYGDVSACVKHDKFKVHRKSATKLDGWWANQSSPSERYPMHLRKRPCSE